jgi:hypothetical protein
MKKRYLVLLVISLLAVGGFLSIRSQVKRIQPAQAVASAMHLLGSDTLEVAHTTMKPAFYQYFHLQKEPKGNIQKRLTLDFRQIKAQKKEKLLHFSLINTSTEAIVFPTENGSLVMIQEARNEQGTWQAIEYWDKSWGGATNFAAEFSLLPQHSVALFAPLYEGSFSTRIRFKLKIRQNNTEAIFYSAPFEGSISLSQFQLSQADAQKHIEIW